MTTPEEEQPASRKKSVEFREDLSMNSSEGRQKSKRFFDIAENAANTYDGEETLMDRVMLGHNTDSVVKSNSVVRLLQSMITTDDADDSGMEESSNHGRITREDGKSNSLLLKSIRSDDDLLGPEAEEFIRRLISQEFPQTMHPTLANLINVGSARTTSMYKPGEWVEILGQDMTYRLEMVTRVLKLSPPEWDWNHPDNEGKDPDWNYFYHAGDKRMILAEEVRSPKEGLVRIFGQRPWIWQQWACLKLEHILRFQEGHQNDFMSKDIPKYAADLWDKWLNNPKNADFCELFYDPRVGDRGRHELINHIMSPFNLMDRMIENDTDWNFEEETRFSVFTYLGMLGSGYTFPIAIIILQVAIPGVLIWNLLNQTAEATANDEECANISLIAYSSLCSISPVAQAMALVVLLFYMCKVVPDTLISFYETAGTGKSIYSRLVSLRREIWFRGDDRAEQLVGFRMDIYMNTGYVNILYMLNMFIIINTDDAFEILLNALAFEFVINLDEAFVESVWWDPNRRWIMAASMELVVQSVVLQSALSNARLFAETFGMNQESVLAAASGDPYLFKNANQSAQDQVDSKYMNNDEIVKHLCLKAAIEANNEAAITEYKKPRVYFGWIVKSIKWLLGHKDGGAFDRYAPYRTWSRWRKLLYLAPVPDLDETLTLDNGVLQVKQEVGNITSTEAKPFENLDQDYIEGKKELLIFCYYFWKVITFQYLIHFCRHSWKKRHYWMLPLRAIDSVCQWFSFIIQVLFPLYTLMCIVGLGANMVGLGRPVDVL